MIHLVGFEGYGRLCRYPSARLAAADRARRALPAELRPERASNRFSRCWVLSAVPLGDPGEGRIMLNTDGTFVIVCAVGCIDAASPGGERPCPGHRLDAAESAALMVSLT